MAPEDAGCSVVEQPDADLGVLREMIRAVVVVVCRVLVCEAREIGVLRVWLRAGSPPPERR